MDGILQSSLPWQLKVVFLLLPALMLSVALLSISKKRLANLGGERYRSPNWVTLLSIPIFLIGLVLFLPMSPFFGFQVNVLGNIMDVLDGKKSVAMDEFGIPRSKLDRWIGQWFDPLADKIRILPALALFAWLGLVNPWIAAIIIVTDAAGTIFREPFTTLLALRRYAPGMPFRARLEAEIDKGLERQAKAAQDAEKVKSQKGASSATAVGKVKALVQCFGLIACGLCWLQLVREPRLPDWLFAAAAVFGLLSVASRSVSHPKVLAFLAHAGKLFRHRDVF